VDILAGKSYSYIVLVALIVFLSLGAASSILQNHFADRMAQGYLMEYCLSTAIVQVLLSLLVIWIMKGTICSIKTSLPVRACGKGLSSAGLLTYSPFTILPELHGAR